MNDIQKNDIQPNNVRSKAAAYNLTLLAFTDNIDSFNFNENMRLSVILPNVVAPSFLSCTATFSDKNIRFHCSPMKKKEKNDLIKILLRFF